MKKNSLIWGGIILLAGIATYWFTNQNPATSSQFSTLADRSIINWQLKDELLRVEVVNTEASVTQGLSGRTGLSDIDGMLFVFDESAIRTFWMKEMLFAIDIIWLNEGKVIWIESNVQPPKPGLLDSEIERRTSPAPVDMVLETLPGRLAWD